MKVVSIDHVQLAMPAAKPRRATLAEIHNWFSEGFDTADLKDAKGRSTSCVTDRQ